MAAIVVEGANYVCTMGTSPASLLVTSQRGAKSEGKAIATIKDAVSLSNILPCGMCTSIANPQVASATAAALGVLTPQPCIPSVSGMWAVTQNKVLLAGIPCLCNNSKLICNYTGIISITNPAQVKVNV